MALCTVKDCNGCMYFQHQAGFVMGCNYYLETGNRRPCGAGGECTVKAVKHRNSKKGAVNGKDKRST